MTTKLTPPAVGELVPFSNGKTGHVVPALVADPSTITVLTEMKDGTLVPAGQTGVSTAIVP